MTTGLAEIDLRRAPRFIQVTLLRAPEDQAEFDTHVADLNKIFSEAKPPLSLIYDSRKVARIPPTYITQMVSFMRNHPNANDEFLQHCAIVAPSDFYHNLLESLVPSILPKMPVRSFLCKKAALRWVFSIGEGVAAGKGTESM